MCSSWFFILTLSTGLASMLDELETMLAVADKVMPQGLIIVRTLDDDAEFVQRDLECPCGRDVLRLCDIHATDDYTTVYEKRLCLARNADKVTDMCKAHLAQSPTVVEYCASDIDFYCPNVAPGDNRVHTCLAQNELLPECAMYVASVASPPQAALVKAFFFDDNQGESPPQDAEPEEEKDTGHVRALLLVGAAFFIVSPLCVFARYAYRKYKIKKQAHDFKAKLAPLLIEG